MTDVASIIKGLKKNDRTCQKQFYYHFYDSMFYLVKQYFMNDDDALAALNTGMLKVFQNIQKYDSSKASLNTWVHTIVKNTALTQLSQQKSQLLGLEDHTNTIDSTQKNDLDAEYLLNKKYENEQLNLLFATLPEATKKIASLHYLEGYKIFEIANLLHVKEGTVKWHLSECRNKLKTLLENQSKHALK